MDDRHYVVTNDKWMRLPGGRLHKQDRKLIKQAGKGAQVINFEQLIERMQKEEPTRFHQFRKRMEKDAGHSLTVPQLMALGYAADNTKNYFDSVAKWMHIEWAWKIREARVQKHMTWRSIAAEFFHDPNQLLGMALCDRAAKMCGEDYAKDPWN